MTPEEEARIHWLARLGVYSEACDEIVRERREWRERGFATNPEVDASERRRFVKYLRLAREAKAHLDAMERKKAA